MFVVIIIYTLNNLIETVNKQILHALQKHVKEVKGDYVEELRGVL